MVFSNPLEIVQDADYLHFYFQLLGKPVLHLRRRNRFLLLGNHALIWFLWNIVWRCKIWTKVVLSTLTVSVDTKMWLELPPKTLRRRRPRKNESFTYFWWWSLSESRRRLLASWLGQPPLWYCEISMNLSSCWCFLSCSFCLACGRPTTGLLQKALGGTFTMRPSTMCGAQLTWQVRHTECAPTSLCMSLREGSLFVFVREDKTKQTHRPTLLSFKFMGVCGLPSTLI
jgi:hypothetical protein